MLVLLIIPSAVDLPVRERADQAPPSARDTVDGALAITPEPECRHRRERFYRVPIIPVLMTADLLFLHSRPLEDRVLSVVPERAWSAGRTFWIRSHEVQLSPTTSKFSCCHRAVPFSPR
jgi:hypothetical protein